MGKNLGKSISENLGSKDIQKLFDHAKQSATDALKTASKKAIQKTAEETGDLIGNKIADKITKASKHLPQNTSEKIESEREITKKRYISSEKRQKIIDDLRLI